MTSPRTVQDTLYYLEWFIASGLESVGISYERVLARGWKPGENIRVSLHNNIEISNADKGKVSLYSEILPLPSGGQRLVITGTTFRHGGQSFTFDSEACWSKVAFDEDGEPIYQAPNYSNTLKTSSRREASDADRRKWFDDAVLAYQQAHGDVLSHPYVARKHKGAPEDSLYEIRRGTLRGKDVVFIPLYRIKDILNNEPFLVGIQVIQADGDRRIYGIAQGCVQLIGCSPYTVPKTVGVCEGFFSAVSARDNKALNYDNRAFMASVSADNLATVVEELTLANVKVLIAADNDVRNDEDDARVGNTGVVKAIEAAYQNGIDSICIPVNDERTACDFNDTKDFIIEAVPLEFTQVYPLLLKYQNERNKNKLTNSLYSLAAKSVPHRNTVEEVAELMIQLSPSLKLSSVIKGIQKALEKSRIDILKDTSIPEQHSAITYVTDAELLELYRNGAIFQGRGAIVVDSNPMGSGKTEMMVRCSALVPSETKQTHVSPRQSLTAEAAAKTGFTLYTENEAAPTSKRIATVVNSLYKFGDLTNSVVFFDEFNLTLNHIAAGTVSPRAEVFGNFTTAVERSKVVHCADAQMNHRSFGFLFKHANGKRIFVVKKRENQFEAAKKALHIFKERHIDAAVNHLADFIREGGTAAVACDSRTLVKTIEKALVSEGIATAEQILTITSENKGGRRQVEWSENADLASTQYKVLLYSPAISSGVSLKEGHFDRVYMFYTGVVPYEIALQMTCRVRTVSDVYVHFKNVNYQKMPTSMAMLMEGEAEKDAEVLRYFNRVGGINELGQLKLEERIRFYKQRRNFAQNFCIAAELHGFTLAYVMNEELRCISTKQYQKAMKAEEIDSVLSAADVSDEEGERLLKNTAPTQEETYTALKFLTQRMVGSKEIIEEDVKQFKNGAYKALRNYENLLKDKTELMELAKENLESQDKETNAVFVYTVMWEIIKVLTAHGNRINKETAGKVVMVLRAHSKGLAACGFEDYSKAGAGRAVATVGNFLKKFGFKLTAFTREDLNKPGDRRGERVYTAEVAPHIARYLANRNTATNGVYILPTPC